MAAVLDNNSIRIPTGAKVSILYNNNNSSQGQNQWKAVEIVDDESNKFSALFECDNVDFKIRIDNRESNIRGGLAFTVKTSSMEEFFYVGFNRLCELETLESGGGKLHFVSQESIAGRQLVDIAAKELETTHNDASAKVSRMEIQFEAEKVPKEVIRIFVKTDEDKTLDLDVKISGTIADVKQQIFNMEGISADKQRLIFAGEELEDKRTIADYELISEHATLLLQSQPQLVMSYSSQSGSDSDSDDGLAVGRCGDRFPRVNVYQRRSAPSTGGCAMSEESSEDDGAEEISPNVVASTSDAERGVICFGEKSDQEFDTYNFIADTSIEIKPIIIEFLIKKDLKLRC